MYRGKSREGEKEEIKEREKETYETFHFYFLCVFRVTEQQKQQRLNLTFCGLNSESFAWQREHESSAGATTPTSALYTVDSYTVRLAFISTSERTAQTEQPLFFEHHIHIFPNIHH